MTTSGSVNFAINRNQIITDALEDIGAIGAGDTPDDDDIQACALKLNIMVKAWMAQGIHLWALEEATLFLTAFLVPLAPAAWYSLTRQRSIVHCALFRRIAGISVILIYRLKCAQELSIRICRTSFPRVRR